MKIIYRLIFLSFFVVFTNAYRLFASLPRIQQQLQQKLKSNPLYRWNRHFHLHDTVDYDISTDTNGVHTISFEVAGKTMSFETGKIGRQAAGSVVARTGDTMVYSTVCMERESTPVDFTPLRVDYFSRYSAVGQTIGAFHRRDSRGDDGEILVARLIDRPLRPMITEGWQHETQVLAWLISYDKKHASEPLAINAASAAMAISPVPMAATIAGVEVGMIDNKIIINPTKDEKVESSLHMTLAGTKAGILMIEGESDFLTEEQLMEAIQQGHLAIQQICDGIKIFQEKIGKEKKIDTLRLLPDDLVDQIDQLFGKKLNDALSIGDKHERGKAVGEVENEIYDRFVTAIDPNMNNNDSINNKDESIIYEQDEELVDMTIEDTSSSLYDNNNIEEEENNNIEDEASELNTAILKNPSKGTIRTEEIKPGYNYDPINIKIATKKLLVRRLREMIQRTGRRSDGRNCEDVRPIMIETGFLPGAHGSTLFTRGETQSLSTATLGSKAMEARYETVDESGTKRFYLQYRFPPSSVGEVGRVGGVNRREVGHGNLAERALLPAIPSMVDFPYSIRAESLITESCGSSSMATVCGCSLAMLDAGVPLKTSVAGVAMGLILGENEDEDPVILTDILGLEDALGTMDFKIAGNETGITTFQLDIKSEGLTLNILKLALQQAKRGRLYVLNIMKQKLSIPNSMKNTVPRLLSFQVPPETIGKLIGPKGKTVQQLIDTYELINIDIQDDGLVQIESTSDENIINAKEAVLMIVKEAIGNDKTATVPEGPPPEIGTVYRNCSIVTVTGFGVFVEVLPGYEGLVHVSELDTRRISSPEAAGYEIGQQIDVKYIGDTDNGKRRLSRRQVLLRDAADTGTSIDIIEAPEQPPIELVINTIYKDCEILSLKPYGVFVKVVQGREGLVHVSELDIKEVNNPEVAGFKLGQKIDVLYKGKNSDGKLLLSRKDVLLKENN